MKNPTHPLLLLDFYKATHHEQYPKGLTKLVSYFTPRMSRLPDCDEVVFFGLQAFLKTYLIDYFNEYFFKMPLDAVLSEYQRVLDHTLGAGCYDVEKVRALHNLGYLPLMIRALPEGTKVPMKIPCIEISNTHPDFAWLVNTIESLLSAEMWHPMVSATVGYMYRQIVDKYYNLSVDDTPKARALSDFSFRGQESLQSATASSAAFCLSFLNTATVPAILYLERNYLCDCEKDPVAYGLISTEHSVMCSNYSVDGDERPFIRRLITEIYPHQPFAIVCDSYDYWNIVDNILPSLKREIEAHDGLIYVRGDSGDPVDIVTETVFHLADKFGFHLNSKGYKVLNSNIRASYGDSITVTRARRIYEILTRAGFAANNVSLGVGSFSMQCMEDDDNPFECDIYPFTRDTFGIAVKSTYGEANGKSFCIFKDPKTDTGHFKKSQRGYCMVYRDKEGKLSLVDGLYSYSFCDSADDLLNTVFLDGRLAHEQSLSQIRNTLHQGGF